MCKLYSIRAPYAPHMSYGDMIMAGSRQDVHLPIFKGGRSGLGSICASACPTFSPVCQQRGQKKHFTAFNVACCGCLSRTAGHSPPSSVGDPQGQQTVTFHNVGRTGFRPRAPGYFRDNSFSSHHAVVSSGMSKVNIRLEVCGVETAERCSSALGLQDSDFV